MTKQEFEKIAGYEVTLKDYTEIIEPMYMSTNLNKQDFVKTINKKTFQRKREPNKITVGVKVMPNGTWMVYEGDLIDVNIKTGKAKVKRLGQNRCWSETTFSIWSGMVQEV